MREPLDGTGGNGATVLLARPHLQIVEHMKGFISSMGLRPRAIETISELDGDPSRDVRGAVISTTVTSTIPATYPEVLQLVRERHPDLPIVFATIADARVIAANVEVIVRRMFRVGSVALTSELEPDDVRLGSRELYLVVTKGEIVSEESLPAARAVVRRHFGG